MENQPQESAPGPRIMMTVKLEIERVEGGLPVALGFKVYEGMPEAEFHALGKCLTRSASDVAYGRVGWGDGQ